MDRNPSISASGLNEFYVVNAGFGNNLREAGGGARRPRYLLFDTVSALFRDSPNMAKMTIINSLNWNSWSSALPPARFQNAHSLRSIKINDAGNLPFTLISYLPRANLALSSLNIIIEAGKVPDNVAGLPVAQLILEGLQDVAHLSLRTLAYKFVDTAGVERSVKGRPEGDMSTYVLQPMEYLTHNGVTLARTMRTMAIPLAMLHILWGLDAAAHIYPVLETLELMLDEECVPWLEAAEPSALVWPNLKRITFVPADRYREEDKRFFNDAERKRLKMRVHVTPVWLAKLINSCDFGEAFEGVVFGSGVRPAMVGSDAEFVTQVREMLDDENAGAWGIQFVA